MPIARASNPDPFSECSLLQSLTSPDYHPNFIVICGHGAARSVVEQLGRACAPPLHVCRLPGPLTVQQARAGTLLLDRVEWLTLAQQIALCDWLTPARSGLQVVSVTTTALETLVWDGRFLEALYWRISVVRLEASGMGLDWRRGR